MRTPEQLRNMITQTAGLPLQLVVTRNRVSMVSLRFSPGLARLRVNQAFLCAPDPVVEALGTYLATRSRAAWSTVSSFAATVEPGPAHNALVPRLYTQGRVYDLAAIRDRINQKYFSNGMDCRIGWSRPGHSRRRARTRSIRFGSYNKALNLIRINTVLDDARVPPVFIDYIVFHEMLHAAVPSKHGGSRWRHHHGSFRILERRFPDFEGMNKMAGELVALLSRA